MIEKAIQGKRILTSLRITMPEMYVLLLRYLVDDSFLEVAGFLFCNIQRAVNTLPRLRYTLSMWELIIAIHLHIS